MRVTKIKYNNVIRKRRAKRVRSRLFGTAERPRLSVHRSGSHIFAQLIDDEKRRTIASASDTGKTFKRVTEIPASAGLPKTRKIMHAYHVGKQLAAKAKDKRVTRAIFDRGSAKFHGRVKAVAQGARDAGLIV